MKHTAKYYYNEMQKVIEQEMLNIGEGERFIQCYSRTDRARRQFPKWWFISNYGRILNVKNPKNPKFQALGGDRRPQYKVAKNKVNKLLKDKNITAYDLVAIVFGSYCFGRARKLLNQYGLEALGNNDGSRNKVNGHHIEKFDIKKCLAANCDFKKIQLITSYVHKLFDVVPDLEADLKEYNEFFKKLDEVVMNEFDTDNMPSIVFMTDGRIINRETGEVSYDGEQFICEDSIMSEETVNYLQNVASYMATEATRTAHELYQYTIFCDDELVAKNEMAQETLEQGYLFIIQTALKLGKINIPMKIVLEHPITNEKYDITVIVAKK